MENGKKVIISTIALVCTVILIIAVTLSKMSDSRSATLNKSREKESESGGEFIVDPNVADSVVLSPTDCDGVSPIVDAPKSLLISSLEKDYWSIESWYEDGKVFETLTHVVGDEVTEYHLAKPDGDWSDDDLFRNAFVADRSVGDKKLLISAGSRFYIYDTSDQKLKVLTDETLDFQSPIRGELVYTNWDHEEIAIDWANSEERVATGRKVICYRDDDFSRAVVDGIDREFYKIQSLARDGDEQLKFNNHYVLDGMLYDYDGSPISNIHLPEPFKWNKQTMATNWGAIFVTDASHLTVYRYGEATHVINLPGGRWHPIRLSREGEEGDDFLVINYSDDKIYRCDKEGSLTLLAEDVQDYHEAYGELYWMNSRFEAYRCTWQNNDSILIGENAVGISKYIDERAGFIVKPGDPRENSMCGGTHLCTMYGEGWLKRPE